MDDCSKLACFGQLAWLFLFPSCSPCLVACRASPSSSVKTTDHGDRRQHHKWSPFVQSSLVEAALCSCPAWSALESHCTRSPCPFRLINLPVCIRYCRYIRIFTPVFWVDFFVSRVLLSAHANYRVVELKRDKQTLQSENQMLKGQVAEHGQQQMMLQSKMQKILFCM